MTACQPARRWTMTGGSRSCDGCCTTATSISANRFVGSVLLLYGKPITQIASLQTTAINVDADGQTMLRLGRGEIPLPEPLDAIALALGLALRPGCCQAVTLERT